MRGAPHLHRGLGVQAAGAEHVQQEGGVGDHGNALLRALHEPLQKIHSPLRQVPRAFPLICLPQRVLLVLHLSKPAAVGRRCLIAKVLPWSISCGCAWGMHLDSRGHSGCRGYQA